MKKKNRFKRCLLRPADGFLPLAFIVAAVLGKSTAAEQVYLNTLFPALFALATARGVRIAFSEQPSMRRVAGSVKLALALQFIGALAFMVVDLIRNQGQFVATSALYICAGMMLNIEHVFYEYLFATGDGVSATRVRAITATLTGAGILMTTDASTGGALPYALEWLLGGAALSAVLATFIGGAIGGKLKGRVNNRVLKCAPLALVQSAVYPLMWLLALMLLKPIMFKGLTALPFFAGLMMYELARTPFRRTGRESKALNIAMLCVALVGAILISLSYVPTAQDVIQGILGKWAHELPALGVMLVISAVCGFGMYGSIGVKG